MVRTPIRVGIDQKCSQFRPKHHRVTRPVPTGLPVEGQSRFEPTRQRDLRFEPKDLAFNPVAFAYILVSMYRPRGDRVQSVTGAARDQPAGHLVKTSI
jgi:hypothetical protein